MTNGVIRIFSDLHLGDLACRVRAPLQLAPLFDGAGAIVFNGDSLDTRPGPVAVREQIDAETAATRAGFLDFLSRHAPPTTLLTGNHDPDISTQHELDLANGQVFVTHGDVFFDDIVPWSRDVPRIRTLVGALSPAERTQFTSRLAAFRRICARIPQRNHHVQRNWLLYSLGVLADTTWPPTRILGLIRTWRKTPSLAAAFVRPHRPHARFLVMGHTHRAGVTRAPGGLVIINTGSFCAPAHPCAIDLAAEKITVRRIVLRRNVLHFGETLSTFALNPVAAPAARNFLPSP